jgi:molecular chaperone DnaJ
MSMAMNLKTTLKTLEITAFTGPDDIKSAFRRLAHDWHPDKNPNPQSVVKFRELVVAYEFLKDHLPLVYQYFDLKTPSVNKTMPTAAAVIENLDDIFDDIFGFSKSGRILGYQEPQDLALKVEEFLFGAHFHRTLTAYQKCSACQGLGAQEGGSTKICRYCFGKGMLVTESGKQSFCRKCRGRGRQMANPCTACQGFGRLKCRATLEIVISAGLKPGQMVTLDARHPKTGQKFELFINPVLIKNDIFQIENYDLVCEYPIDFGEMSAGLVISVATFFGKKTVTVPRGARDGDVLRVPQAGLYKDATKKHQGDLRVVLRSPKRSFWQGIRRLIWKK